jgi:hypothetical protein
MCETNHWVAVIARANRQQNRPVGYFMRSKTRHPGTVRASNVDSFLAQQIALSDHPESGNCEVMIKRIGEPYSGTLHDDEAGCIDRRQFVEVGAPKIFPRPLQIA